MSTPDFYLVGRGGVYTLSDDHGDLLVTSQSADGTVDWENLGEIFEADGAAPHIETIRQALLAAKRAEAELVELY